MRKIILFPLLFISLLAFSQNDSLVNGNFETGDCSGWQIIKGTVPASTPPQPYTFISSGISTCDSSTNHNIVSIGNDAVCGFPKVFPGGGNYSLQLGNGTGTGNGAARIQQTFEVDTVNNVFAYHYAVVLNDAGHTLSEQPYFTARMFNVNGDTIHLKGLTYLPVSSGGDPDFIPYVGGVYLDWHTQYVDLSSYVGQDVTIEFTTGDCAQGGHYSYAYVDAECIIPTPCMFMDFDFSNILPIACISPGNIEVNILGGDPPFTYNWSSGDTTSSISPITSGVYSLTLTDSSGCVKTKTVLVNGASSPSNFDLEANISSGSFRPNQTTRIDLNVFNDGCVDTTGQLTLVLDNRVTMYSSYPVPDYISGDTLIWNTPTLNYDSAHFRPYVYVTTNGGVNIGDTLCFDIQITPTLGDVNTTNNYKNYCRAVINSYDPNYKDVYPKGECDKNYVLNNQELVYTVHFQNTGTAPAIDIYVLDTLNASLDINTVRVIGQSHEGLITEVENGNVLNFKFDNINLPDSTSNEEESHGYVIFRVEPINNIAHQTKVENSVGIYFDSNLPIYTNTVFNTFVDSIPNKETILTESAVTSYDLNGITYDSTGTYYQYLASAEGCDSTIILNLTITTTGINVLNSSKDVVVYPNPIRNELKISVPNTFSTYQVEVISITGQPMFKGNNTSKINTTSFAQGVYFVKVWNDKQVQIKKIVKE
ncbi:MAG: T9SS type A sorting domain-containing protein [Flavobacteriales bacterium]|nr:T9SS type A sorting domain-containing protein [Flavobacteriales bacterium]MCB9175060.1 T9SS type A sorting domain-containing protein [Flavobacteriales bacterium]